MESIAKKINKTFIKTTLLAGIFVLSFLAADSVLAAAQFQVKNNTNPSFSAGSTYATSVRVKPGDTLDWQIFASGTGAQSISLVLPSDLTYVSGSSSVTFGNAATVSIAGSTVTWTFAPAPATEIIRFQTTVASGATLSTTHTHNLTYTTDTAVTSDTVTVKTGPVLKTISPSSGVDDTAIDLTLTGHGFTAPGDITSITMDGTNIVPGVLTVTGPVSGIYTITGVRVPAGKAVSSYYIILSTTVDGNVLTTEANTGETVLYSVTDGTEPLMTAANSYVHSTGVLTLTFNEAIDVSQTDLSKITLYDAAAAGQSFSLDTLGGATKSTTDATTITFTLSQSQKNTVSTWGQTAANLYVQIAGSGIYDMAGNILVAQGGRTAFSTWTKDTTQPTAAITYSQNGATTTNVKAGDITITATFSEPMSGTPKIAIDQPGATDIVATDMTGSSTTWTYTYTINAVSDGASAVTISNAVDYANNATTAPSNASFTIDRVAPTPAVSGASGAAGSQTSVNLSWTAPYSGSDFSTYKIYYSTSSNVSSSNGTEINKNSSGYSALGTSSTGSATVSSLTAGSTYYFAIYICDLAGNCGTSSNVFSAPTSQPAIIPPSGGGGGGGGTAPAAPSTASAAGTVTPTAGGSVTTTLSDGSAATAAIPSGIVTANTTLTVSEATATQKSAAPIGSSAGTIITNTVFDIQLATGTNAILTGSANIELTYNQTNLGSLGTANLRVARFDTATSSWTPLVSTVNTTTHRVFAQTSRLGLFALISFVSLPDASATTPPATEPTTPLDDSGQILGSSIGAYPNGTLLKAPDSSTVWYIAGDKRHAVPSSPVFQSRFNWADIVYLPSSRQIDLYEQGEDVKFATNTLVKEAGVSSVYRVSATNGLQPIISLDVFLKRFYRTSDIVEVEPGALDSYPREAYITEPGAIYSGELVAVPQKGVLAPVYYIDQGQARGISNRSVFDQYAFKLKQIRAITAAQLKTFTIAQNMPYPDGTLLKGSKSTVYIVSNGKKMAFYSGSDLDALLYNRKRIKIVVDSVLAAYENASQIRLVRRNIHTATAQ